MPPIRVRRQSPQLRLVKRWFYRLAKGLGLFAVARASNRRKLRIICFHGFAQEDEHLWNPGLFHHPDTLRARLESLRDGGFNVLGLAEGCRRLKEGTLPADAVVITIDDGFFNTYQLARPLFEEFGFPATLYLTSYYVVHQAPLFRILLQYAAWRAALRGLTGFDLKRLAVEHPYLARLTERRIPTDALWPLIDFAEEHLSEEQRQAVARSILRDWGEDYDRYVKARRFHLLTPDELRELDQRQLCVELHSHRHTIGDTADDLLAEIVRNREVLEAAVGRKLQHFCYPSGVWRKQDWPALERLGIETATTSDPGLVNGTTPRFALTRFLDRDDNDSIVFEAEMVGFTDLLRRLLRTPRR